MTPCRKRTPLAAAAGLLPTTAILACGLLTAISANAAITVSNPDLIVTDRPQGATITTFYDSLTNVVAGNPPIQTSSNRFSLDANDVSGQSFTLPTAITLGSIYMGYNDQQSTGTFDLRIDAGNNGSFDHTYTVTLGTVGDLQTGGANNGPFHFIQFDLSSAGIELAAGVHSFSLFGVTDNGEGGYLLGTTHAGNNYAGGAQITGTSGSTSGATTGNDNFFAVTAVPEPSAALLGGLGMLALLRRRR